MHVRLRIDTWFFPNAVDQIQSLINIIAKAVIYKARNNNEKPTVAHFLNYLKSEAQKERLATQLKNKPEDFQKKWKSLGRIIS